MEGVAVSGGGALPDRGFWRGRRVFLTGHTGFKGTWARLWLTRLGAVVHGYALAPESEPALHTLVGPGADETIADIRDHARLAAALAAAAPEIVLHFAAQPLVRRGYGEPGATFDVNVMGTVALLEAVRRTASVRAVVVVTTDKVYRNDESGRPFGEDDRLGGGDPYSASKAACELVVDCWRRSWLAAQGVSVVTARGGNVVGGGDFAADRLVPDVVRAVAAGEAVRLRHPGATRPWQHVLDCLAGYLLLAEAAAGARDLGSVPEALNFGPMPGETETTVAGLAEAIGRALGAQRPWIGAASEAGGAEQRALALDPRRASAALGWRPRLSAEAMVAWTADWYAAWARGEDARALTEAQIAAYEAL